MNLRFENSTGSPLLVSKKFIPKFGPYKPRLNVKERYSKSGGIVTGDRQVSSRDIGFSVSFASTTDAASISFLNDFVSYFRPDLAPFYLVDTENNRRAEIELDNFEIENPPGLEYRVETGKVNFKWVNAFWEDSTEVETEQLAMQDTDIMVVTNSGKFSTYPVIEIKALSNNSKFKITNQDVQGSFTIESLSLLSGQTIVCDWINGTILHEVFEASITLTGGGPFHLRPGTNNIIYTSLNGDIDLKVRHRALYAF